MHVEPQKEHHWLQKLVGDWSFETEATMEPGKPPTKFAGTETVRSLGGVWVLCEGRGEMPDGGVGLTLMTLGYDPARQRFVGTFIGSMMTHLWIYDGRLEGNTLALDSEGPSCSGDGAMIKYLDVIEIKDDNQRILRSHVPGPDGRRRLFMSATYTRLK